MHIPLSVTNPKSSKMQIAATIRYPLFHTQNDDFTRLVYSRSTEFLHISIGCLELTDSTLHLSRDASLTRQTGYEKGPRSV